MDYVSMFVDAGNLLLAAYFYTKAFEEYEVLSKYFSILLKGDPGRIEISLVKTTFELIIGQVFFGTLCFASALIHIIKRILEAFNV